MLRRTLYAARWVLLPLYLGLVLVLGYLVVVFGRELLATLPLAMEVKTGGAIVAALTLIDLVLVANLLLIVILSGFESFVAPALGGPRPADSDDWVGGVDFAGLKIKLVASIVAISGIELLKRFMALGQGGAVTLADPVLMWSTVIHVVFVISAVLLALMDRLGSKG